MLDCGGPGDGSCASHLPGHRMPRLLAELARRSPWGWRTSTVTSTSPDGWLLLQCEDGPDLAPVRAWHHDDLADRLPVGSQVRLHQRGHAAAAAALTGRSGLVSLHVAHGPPPVPDPVPLETWADDDGAVVIDLRTRATLLR